MRFNKCDKCGKPFKTGDTGTCLIVADITTRRCPPESMRIKLAASALESRTLKVFCKKCINVEDYISDV